MSGSPGSFKPGSGKIIHGRRGTGSDGLSVDGVAIPGLAVKRPGPGSCWLPNNYARAGGEQGLPVPLREKRRWACPWGATVHTENKDKHSGTDTALPAWPGPLPGLRAGHAGGVSEQPFEMAVSSDWTDGEGGRVMAALRHGVGDVTGSTCSPKDHCEGQAHSGEVGGVFVSWAFHAGLEGSQLLGSLRIWLCGGGSNAFSEDPSLP